MNRPELIDALAAEARLSRRQAEDALSDILAAMVETLARGGRIEVRHFGSLTTRQSTRKKALNPRTRAIVDVTKKRLPAFKPAKTLREALAKLPTRKT